MRIEREELLRLGESLRRSWLVTNGRGDFAAGTVLLCPTSRHHGLLMTTPEGEELQLSVIQDGDYFGEIALMEDTNRTATIWTRSECVFLTLQREHFLRFLDRAPHLRAEFEEVVRERLQQRTRLSATTTEGELQ